MDNQFFSCAQKCVIGGPLSSDAQALTLLPDYLLNKYQAECLHGPVSIKIQVNKLTAGERASMLGQFVLQLMEQSKCLFFQRLSDYHFRMFYTVKRMQS